MKRLALNLCLILTFFAGCLYAAADETAENQSVYNLTRYIRSANMFSRYVPQEKVYLHFDNTSYFHNDRIWFKAYVVAGGNLRPTPLSRTLYVDLITPGGLVVDRRILRIENGEAHGDFTLSHQPFYSGFYEIRAYTKYMLNFGEGACFSRVIPVFDAPKKAGEYANPKMLRYGVGKYEYKRPKPARQSDDIAIKFYPEGGRLVDGVSSRVAFEITGKQGVPVKASGRVTDREGRTVAEFSSAHAGKGVLTLTPESGEKYRAEVEYKGKTRHFDLPAAEQSGIVLHVDNLTAPDSVIISVSRNAATRPETYGVAVTGRGVLRNYFIAPLDEQTDFTHAVDRKSLSTGVNQIIVFDGDGRTLAERLVFEGSDDYSRVSHRIAHRDDGPYGRVEMEFEVEGDSTLRPADLSVSVADAADAFSPTESMLTDLLLTSDIKGYVSNPSYYFADASAERRAALDNLMMVQGWRRYSWPVMSGTEPFELRYTPEQGVEVKGRVVSYSKKKPKPGVTVSSMLMQRGDEDNTGAGGGFYDTFETDSAGRFAFVTDVEGKWSLIFSASEKGKKKDCRIMLDRDFRPSARAYRDDELALPPLYDPARRAATFSDTDSAFTDIDAGSSADNRKVSLHELVVTAKKSEHDEIYDNRSSSVAYYDVRSELDDILDSGDYVGQDIHELLTRLNPNFIKTWSDGEEGITYKGKRPMFVIDYKPYYLNPEDSTNSTLYQNIYLEAIKSIYINEDRPTIVKYADPQMSPYQADSMYSCAVFIETYPDDKISVKPKKGMRKTWLDGYSHVEEFYNFDYSAVLPDEPDFRRTLYWNPAVSVGADGRARITFYNNSSAEDYIVTAAGLSPEGHISVTPPEELQ